jgi:thioesterase domain-containing protein
VCGRLEEWGRPARALVLLDTFLPQDAATPAFRSEMTEAMFAREEDFGWATDARLTAMGGYLGLFHGWRPAPTGTPTLLVRAEQSLAGAREPVWPLPHTVAHAPGDHFTMLEQEAAATAGAVDDWLRSAAAGESTEGNGAGK